MIITEDYRGYKIDFKAGNGYFQIKAHEDESFSGMYDTYKQAIDKIDRTILASKKIDKKHFPIQAVSRDMQKVKTVSL